MHNMQDKDLPSQGSGSFLAAKSSIEKDTSTPLSRRVSGSALMSQYCRPPAGAASTFPSSSFASSFAFFIPFVFVCADDFFSTGGALPRLADAGAGAGAASAGEEGADNDDDDGGGDGALFWPDLVFFPLGCLAPLVVGLALALGVRVPETSWGALEEATAADVAVR